MTEFMVIPPQRELKKNKNKEETLGEYKFALGCSEFTMPVEQLVLGCCSEARNSEQRCQDVNILIQGQMT